MTRELRTDEFQELDKLTRRIELLEKLVREARPTVRVHRTGPYTSAPLAAFIPTWHEADYDTDEMWVFSSPTRLTVRTAGHFRVWCNLALTGSIFVVEVLRNGVSVYPGTVDNFSATVEDEFAVGEYVEILITDLGNNVGSLGINSTFGMSFVGPALPPNDLT